MKTDSFKQNMNLLNTLNESVKLEESFNHINDVWEYLEQSRNEEDLKDRIGDIPRKFGTFTYEISEDGKSATITNSYEEYGDIQSDDVDIDFLDYLDESALNEKINKDNLEINNKIQRALRSKGEARKLEPELAKHGIKVNYDYSQGTTMVGPNGKRLSDDKNHVYGPSQAGFNKTHMKTDRSYERWSKDYGNKAEEYELKLKQLKNMDRDDIIRKYNDKSTEEALKAHQAEIERLEKWAKDYRDSEKKYANDDLKARQNARKTRRNGHKNDPRSSYSDPINKTDAPEKYNRETGKYEKSGMSSADKVDYLTYLTKKPTGYRKTGDTYKSGSEYDPADNMNKNLNGYYELKYDEKRANDHLDFKNKYYKVQSDDELKADADKMRAEVEAKIKAAQEQNEKNKKSIADAEAGVQAAKKNIQDYMKKVREERIEL